MEANSGASRISVVVPVYNSENTLPQLCARLEQVLSPRGPFEVILVNDGSRDSSWRVVQELAARYPWVSGVSLMRNYGQHNALLCGIRAARYEIIVTLDDDLQHPPEEIPKLLEQLSANVDVVYGRPLQEQHGLWRDLASQVTKWVLQGAMGAQTARHVSAFRAFRTQVRQAFAEYQGPFPNLDVFLTWGTVRFAVVGVRHEGRAGRASNYTFGKLVTHAINMITGFSTLPLQLADLMGLLFTLVGLGLFLFVIVRYLAEGDSVPGFPFMASVLLVFSGAQLFALGIIGEYLARMHFRMMERPTYAVRTTTAAERAENAIRQPVSVP